MSNEEVRNLLCSVFNELTYIGYGTERVEMIFEDKFRQLGLGEFSEAFVKWNKS